MHKAVAGCRFGMAVTWLLPGRNSKMDLGIYAGKEPDVFVALKHLTSEIEAPCPQAEQFTQEHFQAILRELYLSRSS